MAFARINKGQVSSVKPRQPQDYILAHRLISEYYPDAIVDNSPPLTLQETIFRHLDALRTVSPKLEAVQGKLIIDIASGSRGSPDNATHLWDPWMSRLLYELGAQPHAVDICSQINELFSSTTLDLTNPPALDIFEEGYFDGYYICGFPNTTTLQRLANNNISWDTLRDALQQQLDRICKTSPLVLRGFTEKMRTLFLTAYDVNNCHPD